MITQKDIDKAHASFADFDSCPVAACPLPTRMFELDEECKVGNLDDCVVKEILFDGKAYRIEYSRIPTREQPETPTITGIWWWHDVRKTTFCGKAEPMFKPHLPGQISTSSIDALFHMMGHNGLVCDPRYQRGYVWTIEDQRALIDSIFNRIGIGSFVFSRHSGYRDEKTDNLTTFLNLDGDEIEVQDNKNYTQSVIDGQQRLTTIWRFYTNQFTYKGLYYKDLNFTDQNDFQNTLISFRIFDDDKVKYKEVLEMFLMVNRGVPQDESHLEKVADELRSLGEDNESD